MALPSTMPKADIDLVSTLELNTYTVRFLVDGVVVGQNIKPYTYPLEYPADPVKEGYTFTGWSPGYETMPVGGGDIQATFQVADDSGTDPDDPDTPVDPDNPDPPVDPDDGDGDDSGNEGGGEGEGGGDSGEDSGGDSGGEEGGGESGGGDDEGGEGGDSEADGLYFIKASTVDAVTAAIRQRTGKTEPFTAASWAELILSIAGDAPTYTGTYEVTPSTEEQVLDTDNKVLAIDVTINPIPYAEETNNSGGITVTIA